MKFYLDPIFWAGLGGFIAASIGTWLIWKTKQQDKSHFSRQDYTDEVGKIKQTISFWSDDFGRIEEYLRGHGYQAIRMLEHLYTIDENIFNKLKESISFQNKWQSQKHDERDKIFKEYREMLSNKTLEMQNDVKPEFGACKECWRFLDKDQKKKYAKLNDKSDDFWDWTKW